MNAYHNHFRYEFNRVYTVRHIGFTETCRPFAVSHH